MTESIEQQALRMACDNYLSEYEGTPDLATLDLLITTATVWEPFECEDELTLQSYIRDQYRVNLRELTEVRKAAQAEATALVQQLTAIIVEELLPAAARIAVQDFRRLNETLIASSKFLAETAPTKE